jgi:hypothetical protein
MNRYLPLINFCLVVLAVLFLAGCEERGKQTVELLSEAALDGWVQSNNLAFWDAGGPIVGDLDQFEPGKGYRQFYSFALAPVPAGSTITKATLTLYLAGSSGDPFSNHGVVVVDHLDYGAALDGGDYALAALHPNIGTITDDITEEYKSLDVTAEVQDDLANSRTYSQFRL